MTNSLYSKLALTLALLLFLVGTIWLAINYYGARRHLAEVNQTLNQHLAQNLIASEDIVSNGNVDDQAVKDLFTKYMEINPSIEVYLLDRTGKILGFSAEPGKVVRERVSLEPVQRFLNGFDGGLIVGDDPRSESRRKVFSAAPLPGGYLYVVLQGEQFEDVERALQERHLLKLSVVALAIALTVSFFLGLILFRRITGRLKSLVSDMRSLRSHGLDTADITRSAVSGWALSAAESGNKRPRGDEIDELNRTFRLMENRIADQFNALESNDAKRREFIAHISHDLRTPIASINGYLETLQLKRATLPDADIKEYLATALDQGRHLADLIDRLFELARLDAVHTSLHEEPFSLIDLVHDVVRKLEPLASKRGKTIEIHAQPPLPMVRGDIALIERVLENLLLNAMDHGGNKAKIAVTIDPPNRAVRVDVVDDGEGIEQEMLGSVFEPFVRANKEREQGHAGLGLAIVKRILELHDTKINVRSRAGQGSTFGFQLPIASQSN